MSKPSEQNPYEAPVAGAVKRSALPMPATVKATVAVAAVAAVLSTAGQVLLAVTGGLDEKGAATLAGNVVVWALILIGLVKAHRLAWQWGRLVGGLMVLFALVQTAAAPAAVVFVPLYLAIVVLLSTKSAKRYYDMYCPECDRLGRAADFLFSRAKCKSCSREW